MTVLNPGLRVQAALSTRPTEAPTWIDITPWVKAFKSKRGRSNERDSMQAGTASVTLDNTNRIWDPGYESGRFFGQLKRRRRMRIQASWNGTSGFGNTRYETEIMADAPALWYQLGDTGTSVAADSSGNGEHAVFTGLTDLELGIEGPVREVSYGAVLTPGLVNVGVVAPGGTIDLDGSDDFTLEAWIATTGASVFIMSRMDQSGPFGISLSLLTGRLRLVIDATGYTATDSPQINDGFYHHVAVVFESAVSARMFVDGTLYRTIALTGAELVGVTEDLLIGHSDVGSNFQLLAIGQVAVYLSALSAERIERHYDARYGTLYDVFTGYVERWPQSFAGFSDAFVEVPLADGVAVLATKKITASYPEERSDERIARVLDDAMWTTGESWVLGSAVNSLLGSTTILGPVGDRGLDEGSSDVQASTLAAVDAVSHLRDVEKTEVGLLFINRSGAVRFQARHSRVNPGSAVVFGDRPDLGEFPYENIIINDDSPIFNEVTVTRTGGTAQTAEDEDSELDYFPITMAVSSLAVSDDEAASAAAWLLSRYKQPVSPRISGMVLIGGLDPNNIWPLILETDLGEAITARRRPLGDVSDPIEQLSFIEGIEHAFSALDDVPVWQTGVVLSPADTITYWFLGDSVASLLGTTTRLGF